MKTSIILFAVMLSAVVGLIGINSSGNIVAAKSYKLIVYLDGAVEPNNLGSFKIVIYNSDNNTILSEKVTPDFSDDHQKISPSSGYKITDKEKQHPSQIKVCAQQDFSVGGKEQTHDDCFDIKQNNASTYWYATFDYPLIEGFEAD